MASLLPQSTLLFSTALHSWALPCLCLPQRCLEPLHNCPAFLTVPRGDHELWSHPPTQTPRRRVQRTESGYCRVHGKSDRRTDRESTKKRRARKGGHLSHSPLWGLWKVCPWRPGCSPRAMQKSHTQSAKRWQRSRLQQRGPGHRLGPGCRIRRETSSHYREGWVCTASWPCCEHSWCQRPRPDTNKGVRRSRLQQPFPGLRNAFICKHTTIETASIIGHTALRKI